MQTHKGGLSYNWSVTQSMTHPHAVSLTRAVQRPAHISRNVHPHSTDDSSQTAHVESEQPFTSFQSAKRDPLAQLSHKTWATFGSDQIYSVRFRKRLVMAGFKVDTNIGLLGESRVCIPINHYSVLYLLRHKGITAEGVGVFVQAVKPVMENLCFFCWYK